MLHDSEGLEILVEDDCVALLGEATLGRIAVTIGAVPAIFPVNYCLVDGTVVFRTAEGTKLHHATTGAVVAFEVDHVEEETHEGWSVLVVGVARAVTDPVAVDAALERLPHPWAPGDRHHVVAIAPEFVSGRRIPAAG
ncbi:MAG TPA: pyridoxamine 5'-phosphate oxidase family protein [Acidimicrobiales bacterium]|nr:pyridoxamine 5'-phosphate oxidase family protein [Acidimicrobiales bacterium]